MKKEEKRFNWTNYMSIFGLFGVILFGVSWEKRVFLKIAVLSGLLWKKFKKFDKFHII